MKAPLTTIDIPGFQPQRQGKVREVFDLGERLLLVATDRISAYDCILPQGVPDKGAILTQMSKFWFDTLPEAEPHHLISTQVAEFPEPFNRYPELLHHRSTLVKKAETILIECVVRGYLAGSGWEEYNKSQSVCGILLPKGFQISDELPNPIFTPATKSQSGHDMNISFDETVRLVGGKSAEELRTRSLSLYRSAAKLARERGVIIADTKFEFGWWKNTIILIDEILTPDSSRFWTAADYQPGRSQDALDKQFVRDYLNRIQWDRNPPPPNLPPEIVENTRKRYIEAYRMITGKEWESHS